MKKILFAITSLDIGGAERTLVDLVNALKERYQITILTLYPGGKLERELDSDVKVESLLKKTYHEYSWFQKRWISLLLMIPFYQKKVRSKFASYDKQIAFLEGPMTVLFSDDNRSNIAFIHTDLSIHERKGFKGFLKKWRNQKIYQNYGTLVFVNELNLKAFETIYSVNKKKIVIENYIDQKRILTRSILPVTDFIRSDIPTFVTVARLVYAKRIDRLIEVHARLIEEGFHHFCYVIGDGEEKDKLTALIREHQVEKSFFLLGSKENPYPYMRLGTYFLLPSLYEGSPITLYEAMLLNKYILITDNDSKRVLQSYPNKKIMSNQIEGIYQGMKEVLENPPLISSYSFSLNTLKSMIALLEE